MSTNSRSNRWNPSDPRLSARMLAACSRVHAAVVNIDFQGNGGTTSTTTTGAVIQPSGRIWNVNGPGYDAEVPFVTSEGLPITATLRTDGFTGTPSEGDALYYEHFAAI